MKHLIDILIPWRYTNHADAERDIAMELAKVAEEHVREVDRANEIKAGLLLVDEMVDAFTRRQVRRIER